jgi:hypothetical protein
VDTETNVIIESTVQAEQPTRDTQQILTEKLSASQNKSTGCTIVAQVTGLKYKTLQF